MMNELEIRESGEGSSLLVTVRPGAGSNGVSGIYAGGLKISVTAPADKGKANAAVIKLLSELFGIPRGDIELKMGAGSRKKTFFLKGVWKKGIIGALKENGIIEG